MTFAFRNQPLRGIYLTFAISTLVFLKLPFYALHYILPNARPRPTWSFKRSLIIIIYKTLINIMWNTSPWVSPPLEEMVETSSGEGFVKVDAAPELVAGDIQEAAMINNVSAEETCGFWYGKNGLEIWKGRKARPGEKVIYHFCGGAFVMGTAHPSNGPLKTLIDGLLQYIPGHPALFELDYRKSSAAPFPPANPFPAALLDAVAGYRYLVSDLGFHPENIIIAGDSAGGLLAFWLARYLAISNFPGLSNAGGLLLLSPTVDWANTRMGPTSAMHRNASTDYVYPILASGYTRRALMGKIPESEAAINPWIAPGSALLEDIQGLFAGLPTTCIVSGGAEQTLDGMVILSDRLKRDLGEKKVTYLEYPDATHDVLMASWHEPERTQILERLARWVAEDVCTISEPVLV